MSALLPRNNCPPCPTAPASQTQTMPLRPRAYSQIDNISPTPTRYDYYANEQVAGIKSKYEKALNPPRNKANEENYRETKASSIFQPHDEPSQYRKASLLPSRKGSNYEADFCKQGKPSSSYGRVEIKSQLESNRMTLNAMRNELQAKLSQLNSKTRASLSTASRPLQEKQAQASYEPADTYEAILSKYSKNTDHSSYKYSDSGKSEAFNDTATITTKQRPPRADHKPTLSLQQNEYCSYVFGEKPEEASRSFLKSNQYQSSCAKSSEQQSIGLQFTLHRKEPQADRKETYLSKYFPDCNQPPAPSNYRDYSYHKYQSPLLDIHSSRNSICLPEQSHFKASQLDQLSDRYDFAPATKSAQMPSSHPPKSPARQEPRDNQAIAKEIERLDTKIRQIEQNKKQLNISFKPYDACGPSLKARSNYPNYQ